VAEIFAIGLMLLTRTISGVERLKLNNEVAGFKFAVVGLFYGVLLAFVVIAVWDEYRNTETAVRNEAKAAVDLHRVTIALPFEAGAKIRQLLDPRHRPEWPGQGALRRSGFPPSHGDRGYSRGDFRHELTKRQRACSVASEAEDSRVALARSDAPPCHFLSRSAFQSAYNKKKRLTRHVGRQAWTKWKR
jgi:hypothetical protein